MLFAPSAARSTNVSTAGETPSSNSQNAILAANGTAPSPAHLSLQASHRRGWGSLYAALDRGHIDAEALRKLLARHPLAGTEGETPVYAVDASVWARCDAETSPERGYYYYYYYYYHHPSRHSAGQPIVAGWAYQFVARLNFACESWTAPVDVERVRPAQDANVVAAGQVKVLLGRLEEGEAVPLFVFDAARATTPSSCSGSSRGARARSSSACAPGASLLRRSWPLRSAHARWTPPSPRAEDEVQQPGHLARAFRRARMRRRRLRIRARAGVG
jgi:hypothetical protein